MRLVFAGTPEVALPSLEALLASEHKVVAVLTRPDARSGRGRALHPSPVRVAAEAAGLPVLTPTTPRDPEFVEALRELAPQACPIVAYGGLIPPPVLEIPTHGWVNLHFSLLPAWRGAAPVQHAVIAGDEVTGACTFRLEAGLDTGDVYDSITQPVGADDTAGDLLTRLSHRGAGLLVGTLDALEAGTAVATPQPETGISLAPKLTVDDARLRWAEPATAVHARVRGCTPAPGAWTTWRGDRLKVLATRVSDVSDGPALAPGVLRVGRKDVVVGTGDGAVRLERVQPHGKKPMAAPDWARGAHLNDGEGFDA